jgi:hypothetical protein
MTGQEKGAVSYHRPVACECAATTLYRGNATPDKAVCFDVDGGLQSFRGQFPAMLRAFCAAGGNGVENRQCRLFSLNPGDLVAVLRKRGVRIDTRKGKPSRWILRSDVREVRP